MKIREIIDLLGQFDPEINCAINLGHSAVKPYTCELRELTAYNDPAEYTETILQLTGDYQTRLGWPALSLEQKELQMEKILDMLANPPGLERASFNPRFTGVHGDWRFYYDHGGSQDTCYGTAYDPRLFAELERRGWIKSSPGRFNSVPNYTVTKAGKERLLVISA